MNYFKPFLVFLSVLSGCFSVSAFASFVSVLVDIASSAVGIKISTITAGTKKYNSIIKKKKKKHNNIMLLAKIKLDAIEVLISKALIYLYINHDKFVSVNNVFREKRNQKFQKCCRTYYIKPMCQLYKKHRELKF